MNETATPIPPWFELNRLKSERRAFHRFAGLCAIEPGLASLLVDVLREQPSSAKFKEQFVPRIAGLVGEGARKGLVTLRTAQACDTVYQTLYSLVFDKPGLSQEPEADSDDGGEA